MNRRILSGLVLVVSVSLLSGCLGGDTYECEDGTVISEDHLNDGWPDCANDEDENWSGFWHQMMTMCSLLLWVVLILGGLMMVTNSEIGLFKGFGDSRVSPAVMFRVFGVAIYTLIITRFALFIFEELSIEFFPVSGRNMDTRVDILIEELDALAEFILGLLIIFGFIEMHQRSKNKEIYEEMERAEYEERQKARKKRLEEKKARKSRAIQWKKKQEQKAQDKLQPFKKILTNPSRMSQENKTKLLKWIEQYKHLHNKSYDGLQKEDMRGMSKREYLVNISDLDKAKQAIAKKNESEKAAKEKAEKAAKEKAAKEKAAKEKAAKEKAAKIVAEQLAKEEIYFHSRFGIKGMNLLKWEKEWAEGGQKSLREGEKGGLLKAGIESFLVEAYVSGLLEKGTLLRMKGVESLSEEDENIDLLNIVFSYEHKRAAKIAGLDREWPKKGKKESWASSNIRTWGSWVASEDQIEIMVPGLRDWKEVWKRVKNHFEILVRMNHQCEEITNCLGWVQTIDEFDVIDNILKKEMGDEERRLLAAFCSGEINSGKILNYVSDLELTKDENLHLLSAILDGADEEAVLFEAGLWQD